MKVEKTYRHSIGQCVITHLWENLSFPIDAIPNMKASSWNHLRDQLFLKLILGIFSITFNKEKNLLLYTSWKGQGA